MLSGISVVELGVTRAAAFAGKLMADAGATVTRFEFPGVDLGTAARIYFHPRKTALPWEGTREMVGLLADADVLLTDLGDGRLAELGLDLEEVRGQHPRLAVVTMSPISGPWDGGQGDACGELAMQATSGMMSMTGMPDREPLGIPYHLGCLQLGIHAAAAASAALFRRAAGHLAPTAHVVGADVLASYLRIYGAVSEYYDVDLRREGRRAPGSGGRYPFGLFPCADGYVAMIARSQRDWEGFVAMMGHPSWASEPRYQDMHAIAMEYPDELDALTNPWLMQRTRAELLSLAQEFALPMAPVRRIDELTEDVQLRFRGFFETVVIDGAEYVVPGRPWTGPAPTTVAKGQAESGQRP